MNAKSNSLSSSLVLALVLACGANMAWFMTCMIVFAVSEPWFPNSNPGHAGFALLLPSPAFLAWMELFFVPITEIRVERASNYVEALGNNWPTNQIMMFVVLIFSIVLAVFCYRHQRRYSDRKAVAWTLFTILFGVPGAIGYLLHRRWPVLVQCPHCGQDTPRDRDACLKCNTAFAPPALKGIEVFA